MTNDIFQTEKEAEQAQRINDLKAMQATESQHAYPVFKYEIKNVLIELNLRLMQYVQQFNPYTLTFLIHQTVNDFNQQLVIMQRGKIDPAKPVAMDKSNQQMIFVNTLIDKEDFKQGMPQAFTIEPAKEP